MAASSQANFNNTIWSFPFPEPDWHQTPPSVQHYVSTLEQRLGRQHQTAILRLQNAYRLPPYSSTPDTPDARFSLAI
jgi:hypothetical protein